MRRLLGISVIVLAGLAIMVLLAACSGSSPEAGAEGGRETAPTNAPAVTSTSVAGSSTSSSTTTMAPTTSVPGPPARGAPYVVPEGEVEREAKQLAVDIAYALTTYGETDSVTTRYWRIAGAAGVDLLAEAAEPLTHPGRWSRGEIVYPQLGGLTTEKVSVMVVTRQTVGTTSEEEFSLVRTLDIRLIMGESGWEFDELASAGGVFESVEDLELAHAVAADSRIEMPDSARLDILGGEISPILLEVMLEIADSTSYSVTVMATGHPYHVFETNRVSHHTVGRAIDIHRVEDRNVIDDRDDGSVTHDLVQWLWGDNRVVQVGSPWDVDAPSKKRSFENVVHQDHIHLAVIGPNDPTWVPALGSRVWEDLDADGIQDAGEPGIGGVTVRLFDATGSEVRSTVTDGAGAYSFRDLTWGDWHVEIDVPSGYLVSPRNQGTDDSVDSDIDAGGVMGSTFLDPREHDPRWDAGLYRLASIGDLVWEDVDADGIQDPGEEGMSGVTVRLFDAGNTEVGSTVTDADGAYAFTALRPGVYQVEVDIPDGFAASPQDFVVSPDDEIDDELFDSDIDDEGVMAPTALVSGEHDPRWDAGLHRAASIGGLVWEDLDGDGIQDPGEEGIGGVTVHLFDADGIEVGSTVTNGGGGFAFSDLASGEYHLRVDIPDGYVASPQDAGGDDAVDSDIDAEGVMAPTNLDPDEHDTRWDAGLLPSS